MTATADLHWTVPAELRFWRRVQKGDGCWIWLGRKTPRGYGQFFVDKRRIYAHRFSYELASGPLALGALVCHSCDNPSCVRPDHLFTGTHRDNTRDMHEKGRDHNRNRAKTHCLRGHALAGENLIVYVFRGRRHRACRECQNAAGRRSWQRHHPAHPQRSEEERQELRRARWRRAQIAARDRRNRELALQR